MRRALFSRNPIGWCSGPRIQDPNMHDGMKTKSRPRHARTFIPSSCLGLESEVAALQLALRVRDS